MMETLIPSYDKYAPYIWACYGIVAIVLILLLLLSLRMNRRTRFELERLDAARNAGTEPR